MIEAHMNSDDFDDAKHARHRLYNVVWKHERKRLLAEHFPDTHAKEKAGQLAKRACIEWRLKLDARDA